jgi:hypothetical protein
MALDMMQEIEVRRIVREEVKTLFGNLGRRGAAVAHQKFSSEQYSEWGKKSRGIPKPRKILKV